MKIATRVVLLVCTLLITLMMTGCGGGGGGGTNPFTYFKASNTDAGDYFGRSVALSDDGTTLAVGANLEDSDGITGPDIQSNNNESAAGAVYIFTSVGGWQQQAYVKATNPNPAADDQFGFSVALSGDGYTLAVGAPFYGVDKGAVYVYTRSGSTWTHQQTILGGADNDWFGYAVALNYDGSVLAVGAPHESTSASWSGALYVYTTVDSWSNIATNNSINSSGALADDQLGVSVALNGAGDVLAGGANQYSGTGPGFAKIFLPTGVGDVWASQSEVDIAATGGANGDEFGVSVSLNNAGDMLAVGAWMEGTDNSGAVYIFDTTDKSTWATKTETKVKATSPVANDNFGTSVSLNGSGNTLSVGAPTHPPTTKTGTAYLIVNNGTWAGGIASEQVITPPSGDTGDQFGISVSLSFAGGRLAIGDYFEDSAATGVNGDKTDNSASDSGAAYVYVP